jgi:hypothetical protein
MFVSARPLPRAPFTFLKEPARTNEYSPRGCSDEQARARPGCRTLTFDRAGKKAGLNGFRRDDPYPYAVAR